MHHHHQAVDRFRPRLVYGAILAAATAGLLILRSLASGPAPEAVRLGPVVFLVLLVVQMALLFGTTSKRQGLASAARLGVFVVLLVIALGLRAYVALTNPDTLDGDETYYVSLALRAADGRGLSPFSGVGYVAVVYALAVNAAGPTIFALRTVSLVAGVAGIVFLWFLVRRVYGSGTAWIAATPTSALHLFVTSNTARPDALAFAWVAGALLLVANALRPSASKRSHLLAGSALALFILVNVLPDPDASRIALPRTGSAAAVFGGLHWLELALAVLALAALAVRRTAVDLRVLTLVAAVLGIAAIALDSASPLAFVAVLPALILPMAAFFSHGFSGSGKVRTSELSSLSLLTFAVTISALCAVNNAKTLSNAGARPVSTTDAELVATARSTVGRLCRIAGDGRLFVRHFTDYPYFVSARPAEVEQAMRRHGVQSEAEYWEIVSPQAVMMPEPLPAGLAQYATRHGLANAGDGVWTSPTGCSP